MSHSGPPWPCAPTGSPDNPSSRYKTAAAAPRRVPSTIPTINTASGDIVSGTGVNGSGIATCAASAMNALPATTSATPVRALPRMTLRSSVSGIDIPFTLVQNQNCGKQRDGCQAAQADSECRSITNRAKSRIVRDRKRPIADDGRQRGHDDRLSGFVRCVAECGRIFDVALQHVNRVVSGDADDHQSHE